MDPSDPETIAMLKNVRTRAERLLEGLLKQQAEVEANPPKLAPDKLAQGRYAMQKAIDAARRTLKSLDEAQQIAAIDLN
jgi:hypothetical protein